MVYNYTTNVTGLLDLFTYANTSLMNSKLGVIILVALWFVSFFLCKNNEIDEDQSAVLASFFTTISALFLSIVGLISWYVLLFCILLTMMIGYWTYFKRGREDA